MEGLTPPCVGGGWLPDLKVAAGCIDALGDNFGSSPQLLSWDEIYNADPDVLILSPCGASVQRTLDELQTLVAVEPSFWGLKCVQIGEVYIIDHSRFSRPGPRLVDGVELLAHLLCGIEPYNPYYAKKEWAGDVLKYECMVGNCGNEHCTTELATRFVSVYDNQQCLSDAKEEKETETAPTTVIKHPCKQQIKHSDKLNNNTSRCSIEKFDIRQCTTREHAYPIPRSAHCMVAIEHDESNMWHTHHCRPRFLVFSGEDDNCNRLKDVWKLHGPLSPSSSKKHQAHIKSNGSNIDPSSLKRHTEWTWEYCKCGSITNENVPTPRSNSATIVAGRHLLVFGGWGKDNITPLHDCELLHLDTNCWTHCSTQGNISPPPRGNPTMVYSSKHHHVIMYGGWNAKERLSDLWYLDMEEWTWEEICPCSNNYKECWPGKRTDHTSVL